jgi:L-fuconolactonase
MVENRIVDAHLHLWDTNRIRYPWLDADKLLNRPYLLDDYRLATKGYAVEKMVFVQCECSPDRYKEETDWVTKLAQEDKRIEAIVSWAPLEKGQGALGDLEELSGNRLVKGIRRIIQFESDPDFCIRPKFVEGVRSLARFGLSFDVCVKGHRQMENCLALVRKCPDVAFMLDHIGKPYIKDCEVEPWLTILRQLSKQPNVWCKMSGLVVEADPQRWKKADLAVYVEEVFNAFGPSRVVFGSDWPVVLKAASLSRWIETLDELLPNLSVNERSNVFFGNAVRFYRLAEL